MDSSRVMKFIFQTFFFRKNIATKPPTTNQHVSLNIRWLLDMTDIQEDYIQMQQGIYLPWQLADLEVNQDATSLSFFTKKLHQKKQQLGGGFKNIGTSKWMVYNGKPY